MNNQTPSEEKSKSILMPLKHVMLLLYPVISSCKDLFLITSKHVYPFFVKLDAVTISYLIRIKTEESKN